MPGGPGFAVIYRARIHPGKEDAYVAAWSRITELLRSERGALGSRLHRGPDGIWYAYAQWPSAAAREAAFELGSIDSVAEEQVRDSVLEYFPEIVLEPIADYLIITGAGQEKSA